MAKLTKKKILEEVGKIIEGQWMPYSEFLALPDQVRHYLEYERTCVFNAAAQPTGDGRYTLPRLNDFRSVIGSHTTTEWLLLPEITYPSNDA